MYLSIIVPTYNEETRVVPTIDSLVSYLNTKSYSWEIIICDDGSTDNTVSLLKLWSQNSPFTKIIELDHFGKGWAVMNGMLSAKGSLKFMCDADMSMPVTEIDSFITHIKNGYDIVIGSRNLTESNKYEEPLIRQLIGTIFHYFVRIVAIKDFKDTQCGYKCFTSYAAKQLFTAQKIYGWGFDVEILMRAQKYGLRIYENPIEWTYKSGSKIKFGKDTLQMIRDIVITRLRIFRHK